MNRFWDVEEIKGRKVDFLETNDNFGSNEEELSGCFFMKTLSAELTIDF